jgi:hypothetical protein
MQQFVFGSCPLKSLLPSFLSSYGLEARWFDSADLSLRAFSGFSETGECLADFPLSIALLAASWPDMNSEHD